MTQILESQSQNPLENPSKTNTDQNIQPKTEIQQDQTKEQTKEILEDQSILDILYMGYIRVQQKQPYNYMVDCIKHILKEKLLN